MLFRSTSMSMLPQGNNISYNWQVRKGGTTTGGTWVAVSNSSVSYNITGTSFTGGTILANGFLSSTTQSSSPLNQLDGSIFKFQMERNSFTSTPSELTLVVASDTASGKIIGSIDWEELTR